MKTVLFFRHGKSDWDAPYGRDHERPLAARGRKASDAMGRWLAEHGPLPDRILCSTAKRARQTCMRAVVAGDWKAPVSYHRSLYGATPETLLELIREQPAGAACIMLIGHQPTWSMTTGLLTREAIGHFPDGNDCVRGASYTVMGGCGIRCGRAGVAAAPKRAVATRQRTGAAYTHWHLRMGHFEAGAVEAAWQHRGAPLSVTRYIGSTSSRPSVLPFITAGTPCSIHTGAGPPLR